MSMGNSGRPELQELFASTKHTDEYEEAGDSGIASWIASALLSET